MSLFRLTALLVSATVLLSGCSKGFSPDAVRVACVGDSITWGSIIVDRPNNSYPGQLAKRLGDGYVVGNFGASGTFVGRNGPNPFRAHPFYEESIAFQPDIVVLSVGTNDAKPDVWPKVDRAFYESLTSLVRSYQELPGRPRVILALPTPLFSQKERGDNLHKRIRPQIAKLARDLDLEVIDLAEPFWDKEELFWDGIHPTRKACVIMADQVAKSIVKPQPELVAKVR